MVMEAPPSPDSVGREFVRQYYTLLNKAPTHLHRFYNNQSSFVHGGLDPPHRETSPMVGQKQIHQKIQQLNFQDCHAKIAQVDAQATLGNGVVVQVTGELSNAGQPMRRFTQTFVLAAQSPKKYYVHNDIFRYQDEIISDEECENENRSDVEDEINQERPVLNEMPPLNQQPIPYYSPNTGAPLPSNIPPAVVPHHLAQPVPHVIPPQPMPTVNGAVHPDELNVMAAANIPPHVTSGQTQNIINTAPIVGLPPNMTPPLQQQPPLVPVVSPVVPVEEIQPPIEEIGAGDSTENYVEPLPQEAEPLDVSTEPVSNEPKTYATLLKSGGNMGYASVTQMNATPTAPPKSVSPPPQPRYENRDPPLGQASQQRNRGDTNIRNNNTRPVPAQRMPRQDSARGAPPRNSINEDGNNFEERRRSQGNNFGDSNQLFLGNLPHRATEDDLREIFNQFGTIVDLRIHSKPNTKAGPPGSRTPANYGFITYETQVGVQNCLAAKPIYYPANDKNGVTLNVEEKKTKERPPYSGGGGRINMDNSMGPRPRDSNGPRRGPTVPGQSRGGGTAGTGGGPMGTGTTGGNRPNNFNNRGGPYRGPNSTYNNRR